MLVTMGVLACSGAHRAHEERTLPDVTLTQEDKGRSIAVAVGQTIAINLRENPSTGFRWAMEQGNDKILEPLAATYVQEPGSTVGQGGVRIWEFKAAKEGSVRLAFKLWRAWEGDASLAERFDVMIESRQ